jgi:hypothetical protein
VKLKRFVFACIVVAKLAALTPEFVKHDHPNDTAYIADKVDKHHELDHLPEPLTPAGEPPPLARDVVAIGLSESGRVVVL